MLDIKKLLIIPVFTALAHAAVSTVAVLEIVPAGEMELKITEYRHLTDELRTRAREALPQSGYVILTRDNIMQLMPPDSEEAQCLAESCAVEIGRAIGAEYVTQGFVGNFDGMLTLTVELYESISGNLLGSFVTESNNLRGLLSTIREKAPALFERIAKSPPGKPVVKKAVKSQPKITVDGGTFTDERDGKTYRYAKIGSQTWMMDNLGYDGGDSKICKGKEEKCEKEGLLYDWTTAMDLPEDCNKKKCNPQSPRLGICPEGWRIPSNGDWKGLVSHLNAGSDLIKEFGSSSKGDWWSTEELSMWLQSGMGADSWKINIFGADNNGIWWNFSKSWFRHVRCIKDDSTAELVAGDRTEKKAIRVDKVPISELGYLYINDMHHLRGAGGPMYYTFGFGIGDNYFESEYVFGYVYRWNSWFSLFGGIGVWFIGPINNENEEYKVEQDIAFRWELGAQYIYKNFSVYSSFRNPGSIGFGAGIVIY